ncbi:CBS domain-containing protein [Bowmanella denitrificans]|uniref:CBS domain-containing protein n=1 Tax=Bowmanella denitrificans TaxID=366582 RepID=A0ABN0XKW8_9ALTE
MNLALFQIRENATIRNALKQIDLNNYGVIFVTDITNAVIGIATDGDIRRSLLQGKTLDCQVRESANTNFVWADDNANREFLLKQLDHCIKIIPILDSAKHLIGLVSRDSVPLRDESPVYARARAPVRISFGGGGSDLTHFFAKSMGAVINSTIGIYSHATLRLRGDSKVFIHSRDLRQSVCFNNIEEAKNINGNFRLIAALLKVIQPEFGFELYLYSDYRMKSGLGGSAVLSAAVLGCFNQFRQDRWDLHELAELAYQAERLYLGVAGGWQDQYASVFGGFNFMEFKMEQNIVHPLRIHPDVLCELEENLLLCDSNLEHDSGEVHEDQRRQMQNEHVNDKVKQNVELTYCMRNNLLRGRLDCFGRDLDTAWQLKRQFSNRISNSYLDRVYDEAKAQGALGGKLLGAGGGGFFLFYVPAFRRLELMDALESQGNRVQQFRFEADGLRAWTVRDNN